MEINPIFQSTIPPELKYQSSDFQQDLIFECVSKKSLIDHIDDAFRERKLEKRNRKRNSKIIDDDIKTEDSYELDEIFIESITHPYENDLSTYEVSKVDGQKILVQPYNFQGMKIYFVRITDPKNISDDFISTEQSELITRLEDMHEKTKEPQKISSLLGSFLN